MEEGQSSGSIHSNVPGEFLATINSHVTIEGDGHQKYYLLNHDSILSVIQCNYDGIKSGSDALAFIGIFITITLTLVTAKFEDSFGISKDTIKAIFIVSLLIFGFLFFKSAYNFFRKGISAEKLADEIGKKGLSPPTH